MDWSDWLTAALLLLALWTFIPRPIKRALRVGLEPTVIAVSDLMRAGVRRFATWFVDEVLYRRFLGVKDMSSSDPIPASRLLSKEWLSAAAEQVRNEPEIDLRSQFPPGVPSDDDIMEWLAFVPGEEEGTYRFSASAIGKLFGGRLQDQIDRVREIRGEDPPPKDDPRYRPLDANKQPV